MSFNMIQLDIEVPCTESWSSMEIRKQGAFCNNCCKEVIDFSLKTEKEIVDYFETRKGEKICGRFKNDQLNKPLISISPDILSMNIPLWKKILAILFICFSGLLTGCDNPPANADIPLPSETVSNKTLATPKTPDIQPSVSGNKKNYLHLTKTDSIDISSCVVGYVLVKDENKIQSTIIKEIFSGRH